MVGRNILEHPESKSFDILAPTSSELNLFQYESIVKFLEKNNPQIIIHAAGRVGGIQANIKEPVRFLLENLDMGRNIVWAARQTGIRKLINLGSSCMYPRNALNPLNEDFILKGELEPTNEGYALAKVTIGRLCQYITRENPEFQYKTLIPCNLYGRWDKFDPSHSHLIPAVIHKVHTAHVNGIDEIDIWGDGTARREFMYAGDLADCIIQSVKRFASLPLVMNVGLGHDYTVNQYYQVAAEVIGYKGRFRHDLTKPVGMKQKLVDISKQKEWGWKASTDLRAGIAKTYDYYIRYIAKR